MVYLIHDVTNNSCKIGFSSNPETRLKGLKVGTLNDLKLIAVLYGNFIREKEIHKQFDHYRIRGEWFSYNDEIVKFFKNNKEKLSNIPIHKKISFVDPIVTLDLFSALEKRYINSREFGINKSLKQILAKEINCNLKFIISSLNYLIDKKFIIYEKGIYSINKSINKKLLI